MQIVYANGVLQSLDVQTKRMLGEEMTLIEGSLTDGTSSGISALDRKHLQRIQTLKHRHSTSQAKVLKG